jgi:general secretion pathway protein N
MPVRANARAPWGWGLSGVLLGALLSVLVFAPARWLAAAVRQASDAQVLLQDARGTVWSGSAQLTLTGGAGSSASASLPSRLSWQVQPGLTGLGVRLDASCCLVQPWQFWLAPAWNGATLRVSNSPSNWPAEILMGLGTPFNTIAPQGQLALTTQGLALTWVAGRLQVAGQAQLDAQDISSRLSTLRPMGSYRFALVGGAAPELLLSTLRGSLLLSGRGQWVGGKLRFVGEASSAPEHQAALSNLLNIIGRRNGARSIIKLG